MANAPVACKTPLAAAFEYSVLGQPLRHSHNSNRKGLTGRKDVSVADTAQAVNEGLETCSARLMELRPQERRRSRRIRIGQTLKIRPSDPRDEHFEELNITKNVSREGIYFVTEIGSYYEGMRLFLTVPYHSPSEPMDQEYLGQVTRLEQLDEHRWGVAIQLLTSMSKEAALFGSHGRMK